MRFNLKLLLSIDMTKKVRFIIIFLSFIGMLLIAKFSLAAGFGTNAVNTGLAGSLSATDPRILIGRIVQIALSFLGVIAVLIIMYAGFLWMTSSGDEEKISKAKGILKDGIIGLVIILSSWGIATFLISRLAGAVKGNNKSVVNNNYSTGFSSPGVGTIGACTVLNTYPTDGQQNVARNTSLLITFKQKVKLDSVCVNTSGASCTCNNTTCTDINPVAIRLYTKDLGDACSAISCPKINSNDTAVSVRVSSDNKTLMLTPLNYLGISSGDTPYSIKFTKAIKKLDNSSMFATCSSDFASWNFTVSNKIDLVPPIVVPNAISPLPDNQRDIIGKITPAKAAVGTIIVQAKPHIYKPAQVIAVTAKGTSPVATASLINYHGLQSVFIVKVPETNKAQLFDANNNPLAIEDFSSSGQAVFTGFISFTAVKHPVGSLWNIKVSPEQLADNLTINSTVYTFADSAVNNNILVPTNFTLSGLAANLEAKISGNPAINVSRAGPTINLTAKVLGSNGNNIKVLTTNPQAVLIQPLSGGTNQEESNKIQGQSDKPMNSIIQINFNKAIDPLMISGSASEVAPYIRVVNAAASSSPAGADCNSNSQCQSYKCTDNACVGDYLDGKFMTSNIYRTVEFVSNQECGINACGEKIYCLPPDSHLAVKLTTADLSTCKTDKDCWTDGSFRTCSNTPLGYKTCQNSLGQNYPQANQNKLNGIVDTSFNSLDGNRNGVANGPLSFYNDNYSTSSPANLSKGDNYKWSFYISDKLNLTPPIITSISPIQNKKNLAATTSVKIIFNKIMMDNTLKTGSTEVNNGKSIVRQHFINLYTLSPAPLGYWINASNKDIKPYDGVPDITVVKLIHSPFTPSATFNVQVGSGVKDIYQNCYKPSVGPSCSATAEQPSCCFGTATSTLGANGNCQ